MPDSSGSALEEVEKTELAERSLTKPSDKAVKRKFYRTRLLYKVGGTRWWEFRT
jgi:hypothetical protein